MKTASNSNTGQTSGWKKQWSVPAGYTGRDYATIQKVMALSFTTNWIKSRTFRKTHPTIRILQPKVLESFQTSPQTRRYSQRNRPPSTHHRSQCHGPEI